MRAHCARENRPPAAGATRGSRARGRSAGMGANGTMAFTSDTRMPCRPNTSSVDGVGWGGAVGRVRKRGEGRKGNRRNTRVMDCCLARAHPADRLADKQ